MQSTEQKIMVNFTIDDHPVTAPKGTLVYAAAKALEIDIPIFCYQDRMPPFGACRVCLVEVEKMAKPQTSCTLEATEGMVVRTQSKLAQEGRKSILEFLLINHPLDCPICDRGGECPLQDQVVEFGPAESRFYEEKRHFIKALPLGPVLMLDRERCIACARCVRFGDIVAGDHALEFIDRGFKTEVGTPDGGPADSKFIGNTIMICPVGALTSQVYRFQARPWDNEPTASTCTLCPVGCSFILDSRDGEIVRTRSQENRELNDIWLCDKGWFGYEFNDSQERLTTPLIRRDGALVPASWEEALSLVAAKMKAAKAAGKLAGFGGNPLTVEENYLFQKLMREGAGVNHLDHRIGMPINSKEDEGISAGMEISIGACEELSYAFLLGIDLTEEFPVIWLRLKQAINRGAKVVFLGHFSPEIGNLLAKSLAHAPGKELEVINAHLQDLPSLSMNGQKGAIFIGSQYLNTPDRAAILSELTKLQQSTPNLSLNILEGRGNSMGACLAGMRPDGGPLNEPLTHPGLNALEVLEQAASGGWDYLHVAGADPAKKFPSHLWQQFRAKLDFLVVQDLFLTDTAKDADVVLPTLSFVEKDGHFINIEGRVQKIRPGKVIPESLYSDADIFKKLAYKLNMILPMDKAFMAKLKMDFIPFERSKAINSKPSQAYQAGIKASFASALFDHGNRMQHNAHLVQLAKEPRARIHPALAKQYYLDDHEEVIVRANHNEIRAKIKLDPSVAENTVILPLGFPELAVQELGKVLYNGLPIELRKKNIISP
ncbi:MAG: NADH-quinone oxidoreductase subunit NuoG [Parachlamydiaceae bacterium]|nr:NADH-quinone oxidoreductase subunit NuoG [Parachlamydiaceae bacterium]